MEQKPSEVLSFEGPRGVQSEFVAHKASVWTDPYKNLSAMTPMLPKLDDKSHAWEVIDPTPMLSTTSRTMTSIGCQS